MVLLVGGFIGLVIWASNRANSKPHPDAFRKEWRDQAKADGFTYLYECYLAIHEDRIVRIGYQDCNLDLRKKDIRSIGFGRSEYEVVIWTNHIDRPVIRVQAGNDGRDIYHRLIALIS